MNNNFLAEFMNRLADNDVDDYGRNNSEGDTDVTEYDNAYLVEMALPGFKKDGIHLKYDDNTLYIHAVHQLNKADTDDNGTVIHQELNYSDIDRSFYLPDVEDDKITAEYNGGMLKVTLPKATHEEGNNNEIEIN